MTVYCSILIICLPDSGVVLEEAVDPRVFQGGGGLPVPDHPQARQEGDEHDGEGKREYGLHRQLAD